LELTPKEVSQNFSLPIKSAVEFLKKRESEILPDFSKQNISQNQTHLKTSVGTKGNGRIKNLKYLNSISYFIK